MKHNPAATLALIASLAITGLSGEAVAQAATQAEGKANFDRTTLVVEDMNASFSFWRDVMMFEVTTEPRAVTTQDNPYLGWTAEATQVTFARLRSHEGAGVGLLEVKNGTFPRLPLDKSPTGIGGVVLVFVATDIDAIFERAKAAGAVYKPLSLSPTGRSKQMYLRSPSGHVLELYELIKQD